MKGGGDDEAEAFAFKISLCLWSLLTIEKHAEYLSAQTF